MGFTEGWTAAGGVENVGGCPVPEPHFSEVEYLIDQVGKTVSRKLLSMFIRIPCCPAVLRLRLWMYLHPVLSPSRYRLLAWAGEITQRPLHLPLLTTTIKQRVIQDRKPGATSAAGLLLVHYEPK